MNKHSTRTLALAAAIGMVAATGCRRPAESDSSDEPGIAERTGEAARETGKAVKDATGRTIEKVGEGMEKVGESLEGTGERMQSEPDDTIEE